MCISNLSSNGPDTLERYLAGAPDGHEQLLVGCPKYPQGQGFMAHTSITLHGYVRAQAALEMVIFPFSIG